MPRKQPSGLTRFFRRMIGQLLSGRSRENQRKSRRHLKFEPLEGRQLLASDLASLTGIVSLTDPVEGATVNLYLDDGDGVFDAGDGSASPDLTDAAGVYRFDRLAAGNYWLEQPAQTVGTDELGLFRKLVTISPANAAGTAGTVIDDFADSPAAEVESTSGTVTAVADHSGALGSERDMIVTLKSGTTTPSVTLNSSGNQLLFSSSFDAQGLFNVIYDGNDNDAVEIDADGLAPRDLTQAGANTAIKIRAQADLAGTTVRLRVYTDADHFSESLEVTIPEGNAAEDIVFHFAGSFTGATGTAGPANFANVGAIDVLVETNTDGTDGLVTLLGAFAPIVVTENISNSIDLNLDKSIDIPAPNVGQEVVFTLTLTRPAAGPDATGIVITDNLPAGLEFVSATTATGSYSEATDLWTVGTLAAGATAELQITAIVRSSAELTNTASITSADQPDPDTVDNTDLVLIDAPAAADLSVTITPISATPGLGQDTTFTVTLANAGPDTATNIVVTDVIPAGLELQSSDAEAGTTYSNNTWTIPSLASGEDVVLTVVLRATGGSLLTYSAQVTASDLPDPDSTVNDGQGDDFDSATVDAVSADLSLVITPETSTPNVGQDVTFTVTLTNGGPDTATNIVVTDVIPIGLNLQSATAETGTTYDNHVWTVPSLASGANVVLTIVLRPNSSALLTYSAQVTASAVTDPDSTVNDGQGDDFDSATVDAPAAANLSVVITPASATPGLNQDTTFIVTLANTGPDTATNIVVTDILQTGLLPQSATPEAGAGTFNPTNRQWSIPTLASGEDVVLTVVVRAEVGTELTYSAQVTASDQFDPNSTPNDGAGDDFDSSTVDAISADLVLTNVPSTLTPNFDQEVTFLLTLTNGGPDAATGVIVTDQLPLGLEFVSATPSGTTQYNSTSGVWDIGTLASTANATLSIVARVKSTAALANKAEVTTSPVFDPDSTPNNNIEAEDDQETATVDAPAAANLSVVITPVSATPGLNQDTTFIVTLANTGPDTATNIVVTDVLQSGLLPQSATPEAGAGTFNPTNRQWSIPSLASGEDVVLTVVVRPTVGTALTYSAQVTASGQFDPNSTPGDGAGDDFDSSTVDAVSADLSLAITPPSATPNVGQDATFTVTLTNGGPDTATNVVVTDVIPTGLTLQSSTAGSGTTYASNVWNIPSLASGASVTLTLVLRPTVSTALTYSTQVTASGATDPDSTPNDNTGDDRATATVDAPASADLSITNTPSTATPNFNSNVTYTIVVTNSGPDQATGVVVNDLLPAGLVFVSSNVTQGSYVSGTGVWTVGSINSGSTATLTLVARVNTTASIDNVAQVTASGVPDPDSTPNDNTGDDRAAATVDAPATADLRLAKSATSGVVNVGQPVTFTLTLNNDGPDAATGVIVTDQLPAGLTFVSATASQGTYNNITGLWDVGTVNNGANATLTIIATLATAGAKVNTAQVTASGVPDPDSTPNDNTGDDRATTTVASTLLSKRRFLAR